MRYWRCTQCQVHHLVARGVTFTGMCENKNCKLRYRESSGESTKNKLRLVTTEEEINRLDPEPIYQEVDDISELRRNDAKSSD